MEQALPNAVSNALKKEIKETVDATKKMLPSRVMAIKIELLNSYTAIYKSVFKSVFDNYYGDLYDEDSLMSSLYFGQNSDATPYCTYNTAKFKFSNKNYREKKKFNPNTVSESTVKNFRSEDEAAGLFIEQFFQDDDQDFLSPSGKMDEDSQEDVLADVRLDYYNFNPINQGIDSSTLPSIDETYRVARFRAQQEYEKQYLVELKPMIYKKYGIQLK